MLEGKAYVKPFVEYLQIEKNASPYTVEYYSYDLQSFFDFLQREHISDLNEVDYQNVRFFLTTLYDQQLSRRSVSRKISSIRSFYKFLEREKVVSENPFLAIHLPKMDQPVPSFFYKEELEKLFQVSDTSTPLGQRNQAILEVMYATGIRVSECVGLKIDDIDFFLGTMLIRGKGKKERYLPFGRFAEEALQTYIDNGRNSLRKNQPDSGEVFLNARGRALTTRGVRLILDKLVKKAALTVDIHPHKLRHTFATHMLNEGADLRVVQELLGHENLSSTQVYTHVSKDHLRNIYMNSHPRANRKNN
ncbi:tyrosine recombinase XerC [Radiobacillus kanasensis]|uniref:tyrosine recombinase XerC n=1 Tax=Radiobacillus kanasensis TaxID=2844358 RepID=UPI001E3E750F|nr:tyrosine recombinase XerC [Radiobacillus kanasensis]UFU01366.1 tyrosine recombinase XerC [Radiobacillus kanasensis]